MSACNIQIIPECKIVARRRGPGGKQRGSCRLITLIDLNIPAKFSATKTEGGGEKYMVLEEQL